MYIPLIPIHAGIAQVIGRLALRYRILNDIAKINAMICKSIPTFQLNSKKKIIFSAISLRSSFPNIEMTYPVNNNLLIVQMNLYVRS